MPKILKTKTTKEYPVIIEYLFSVLKGLLFSISLLCLLALLIYNKADFNIFYKAIVYAIIGSGALISGFIAYRRIKQKGILNGLISGLIYGFVITVIIIFLSSFNISSQIIYTPLISVISGIIGGVISANK